MRNLLHWATVARRCTMFPRAVRPSWSIAAFRSMRSKTCFPAPRPTAKLLESSFPQPAVVKGRPLTPLHGGHVALCAVSGMLNGIFGSGEAGMLRYGKRSRSSIVRKKRRKMALSFGESVRDSRMS